MNHNNSKDITINARKFDGSIHRSWNARFVDQKNTLLTFVGEFAKEVNHPDLGIIRRGTISYEFYWLDRWYNVFRFHEPNGQLRNYYCNINKPPTFVDNVLDYIDLDIDILIWQDHNYEILDTEEYKQNVELYNYPDFIKENVKKNIDILLEKIKIKKFPFDFPTNKSITILK
jgi:protein associated with RNAse G/E